MIVLSERRNDMTKRHITIIMVELFGAWIYRDSKLNRVYVGGYIGRNVRRLVALKETA